MSDVVKSIFRQREIEKLYEIGICEEDCYSWKSDGKRTLFAIANNDKVISDKVIGTYSVEIPMLEIGDEFFLCDIQEVVKIKKRMRSSDGSITYYTEDKLVETENTRESYKGCREKIEKWKHEEEKIRNLINRLDACNKEFADYREKYKYKHRFFNKKCSE